MSQMEGILLVQQLSWFVYACACVYVYVYMCGVGPFTFRRRMIG